MAQEGVETSLESKADDSNFEVDWDNLHVLLRTSNPLHDLVTDAIDNLSEQERERIRRSIGYKNVFCEQYIKSRQEWLETAKSYKGRELNPDEVIAIANKHRIYYAITHPRGMNMHPHNTEEESCTYNFLETIFSILGTDKLRAIGYCAA